MGAISLAEGAMLRVRSEATRTLAALKNISEVKYMIERPTVVEKDR